MCLLEAYNGRKILVDAVEFLGSTNEEVTHTLPPPNIVCLITFLKIYRIISLSSWDCILHFTKP